jgi:hypothetical protein
MDRDLRRRQVLAAVINELKNRGVEDIFLIAVVDGLKGFPEAINAVFPDTVVQTCIVLLIRHSMEFASWKDRKAIAGELRAIYRAKAAEAGEAALNAFDAGPWGRKYPAVAQSWRRNWPQVIPFFAFPVAVRRIIYTTNAIEALNAKLRRAVKTRGHFPTDEAAIKLLCLVLRDVAAGWKMPPREWYKAKTQLAIMLRSARRRSTVLCAIDRPQFAGDRLALLPGGELQRIRWRQAWVLLLASARVHALVPMRPVERLDAGIVGRLARPGGRPYVATTHAGPHPVEFQSPAAAPLDTRWKVRSLPRPHRREGENNDLPCPLLLRW